MTMITYKVGNIIDHQQFIELLKASTLGERRPIDDEARMKRIVQHTNLMVTAWEDDQLVGAARSITDFAYRAYLSDLAVKLSHQKQGIGTELIRQTKLAIDPEVVVVLLSAPKAAKFYPKIGMEHHPRAYLLRNENELKQTSIEH